MHMSLNWLPLYLFIILSKILGNNFGKSNASRRGFGYDHKCLWWLQKKGVLTMSVQGLVFGKSSQDFCHVGEADMAAYQNKSMW